MERRKIKYNIGEVAQITGLSIKTLRYYDSKGVLLPSHRDSGNNYRYYSEDQILQALAIREMKLRGIAIEDIQSILETNSVETLNDILGKKRRDICKEIENLEKQMALVENSHNLILRALPEVRTESEKLNEKQYSVSMFPERTCLYTRHTSRIFADEVFWDRFAEIYKLLDGCKYVMSGSVTAIFHEHYTHQFFFEEGDLEILLPVHSGDLNDEHIKKHGGFLVASKMFVGFYNKLLPEYIDLIKWIEKNDYEIIGDAMEEYIVEFSHGVSEDNYVTRISFPVKKLDK